MAAGIWSRTLPGISDLRRFWHVRPWQYDPSAYTIEELVAFHENLPMESATMVAGGEYIVSISEMLQAMTIDAIRQLGLGLGGKKLQPRDSTVEMLSRKNLQKNAGRTTKDDLIAGLKAMQRNREDGQRKPQQQQKRRKPFKQGFSI